MPTSPYHSHGPAGRRRERTRQAGRAGPSRVALALLLPVLLLLAACSVESRYRARCFFFDGVPPLHPVAAGEQKPGAPAGRPAAREWSPSVHKPYADFQCAKCHNISASGGGVARGQDFVIMRPEDGLCAPCHKTVAGQPRFTHAPVLLNACLWCHQSHESRYPALLRAAPEEVCFRCHLEKELSTGDHHPRPSAASERSCIDCHTAHGGERRFFLKQERYPSAVPGGGAPAADPGTPPPGAGQKPPSPVSAASPAAPPA